MGNDSGQDKLSLSAQLAYGIGDLGPSMAGNVLMVFFFFFLTTIARLPPSLAGTILFLSNIWSAISTLIVGILCDRTQSRWGRRRIWMFCSAPLMGISFFLHWWVPPSGDWARFSYYLIVALLFQTAGNAFTIPYGALVTDLTEESQELLRLNGFRFGFSLSGGIGSLLLAQGLNYWINQPQQQLLGLGLACALVSVGSILCCCWGTAEPSTPVVSTNESGSFDLKPLLRNRPLLLLMGIYALSWLSLQITPAILPYFIVNCLKLDSSAIAKIVLTMQATSLVALFIWEQISRQIGKRLVYWAGISLWVLAVMGLFYLYEENISLVYGAAVLMGLGMATAYLVPLSMMPEVVSFDELETGQRREGLIYSILVLFQKTTLAFGLFMVGQLLSWSGFQETVPGPVQLIQPSSALTTIRFITVSLPVLALLTSLVLTGFYSTSQKTYQELSVPD